MPPSAARHRVRRRRRRLHAPAPGRELIAPPAPAIIRSESPTLRRLLHVALALSVAVALLDFWGTRYNLNPDGIAYVEMARNALYHGRGELINGYWSPGYPLLVAPVWAMVRSGWIAVIPVLHAVNLLPWLAGLGLAVRLARVLAPEARASVATIVASVGYTCIAVCCIGMGLLTPDLGVLVLVLLVANCCVGIEQSPRSWIWALALGVAAGAGYWMKGILLPLDAMLLLVMLALPLRTKCPRLKVLVAGVVFVLLSLPLAIMVSRRQGYPTIGEVGRLNYAWEVDGVTPFVGWLGDSTTAFGIPVHPPRLLQTQPRTLEFATPVRGDYPLWYDPAYWYTGLRARVNVAGQWAALTRGMRALGQLALLQWGVIVALALLAASTRRPAVVRTSRAPMILVLWSLASALVYALVHVEARYLAGFVATGGIAVGGMISQRAPRPAIRWAVPIAALALLTNLVINLGDNVGGLAPSFRPDYVREAAAMSAAGLSAGSPAAVVGDAFEEYGLLVAGAPIIAQVMDSVGYWHATPPDRAAINRQLAAAGTKAVVGNVVAPELRSEGWQFVGGDAMPGRAILLLTPPR